MCGTTWFAPWLTSPHRNCSWTFGKLTKRAWSIRALPGWQRLSGMRPPRPAAPASRQYRLITDAIAEMEWWAAFKPKGGHPKGQPRRVPKMRPVMRDFFASSRSKAHGKVANLCTLHFSRPTVHPAEAYKPRKHQSLEARSLLGTVLAERKARVLPRRMPFNSADRRAEGKGGATSYE